MTRSRPLPGTRTGALQVLGEEPLQLEHHGARGGVIRCVVMGVCVGVIMVIMVKFYWTCDRYICRKVDEKIDR